MMERHYDIGMIGLGVMGRNLLLNMADNGFAVAGYDRDEAKTRALEQEGGERDVRGADSLEALCGMLKRPRAVMLLVPAGDPVDDVLNELLPHLDKGDIVIDGGNSHFVDTDRRQKAITGKGIHLLGMGVSGGEEGARHGPSMMPGGDKQAYERIRPIFEAASAKVGGDPCVTWLGPGASGHYVKMVHNGIEYGLMQLIAESYDLLKRGMGFSNDELKALYSNWSDGELNSFLMEITAKIFRKKDDRGDGLLLDSILDAAHQKGTGMWTSLSALELQVPALTIDTAVMVRDMSAYKQERTRAAQMLSGPQALAHGNGKQEFAAKLKNAMYAAFVLTYVQGMALLYKASKNYEYDLVLGDVARIWRGGCIIRSSLLADIHDAFQREADLPNMLLDRDIAAKVIDRQDDLRHVVGRAASLGIPAPGLMTALAYFDAYRSARLPANLIQAQRDFFGAHTYERVDADGTFHAQWNQE